LAGKSKGILRLLTVVSIVATLGVYAVIIASSYTMATSLAQNAMGLTAFQVSGDPSTGITLTLPITVRNPGLLEISITLDVKVLSVGGEVIAEDIDYKRIPSGSSHALSVSLFVPPDKVENLAGVRIFFECRTLFDLVGISLSAEVGREGPSPGP